MTTATVRQVHNRRRTAYSVPAPVRAARGVCLVVAASLLGFMLVSATREAYRLSQVVTLHTVAPKKADATKTPAPIQAPPPTPDVGEPEVP